MREATYQLKLVKKLRDMFPGCEVFENDPAVRQGVPDLLILWRGFWAMLEVKISATAPIQPNQSYYVALYNDMSFAAFIFPENEEQVLSDLQHAFGTRRSSRHSQPKQLPLAELRRSTDGSPIHRRNGVQTRDRSTPARSRSNSIGRKAG